MKLIVDGSVIDTRGGLFCENVCLWWDGTLKPQKGHNATCSWLFDGQIYYHTKLEEMMK